MTQEQKAEITKISKEFSKPLMKTAGGSINGSGWIIIDPLSAYLNFLGFKNKLSQLPETKKRPAILIMTFEDGSQFIPAGQDLNNDIDYEEAVNWMWLN